MIDEKIEAIIKREAAASPPPWVFKLGPTFVTDMEKLFVPGDSPVWLRYEDAVFSSHAREDILFLLTRVLELESELQTLRQELRKDEDAFDLIAYGNTEWNSISRSSLLRLQAFFKPKT